MYIQSTLTCECGCIFEIEYQNSMHIDAPACPNCHKIMNKSAWDSLQNIMGELADFNTEILKWHIGANEPRMLVPAITVRTHQS